MDMKHVLKEFIYLTG